MKAFQPEFVLARRRKAREKALAQGIAALRAIEAAGGNAVLFGSVLREEDFLEGSDIEICLVKPSSFTDGWQYLPIAEEAITDFRLDFSWLDDLRPNIRKKVETEGCGVTSF